MVITKLETKKLVGQIKYKHITLSGEQFNHHDEITEKKFIV